jgi:hypothetical protein
MRLIKAFFLLFLVFSISCNDKVAAAEVVHTSQASSSLLSVGIVLLATSVTARVLGLSFANFVKCIFAFTLGCIARSCCFLLFNKKHKAETISLKTCLTCDSSNCYSLYIKCNQCYKKDYSNCLAGSANCEEAFKKGPHFKLRCCQTVICQDCVKKELFKHFAKHFISFSITKEIMPPNLTTFETIRDSQIVLNVVITDFKRFISLTSTDEINSVIPCRCPEKMYLDEPRWPVTLEMSAAVLTEQEFGAFLQKRIDEFKQENVENNESEKESPNTIRLIAYHRGFVGYFCETWRTSCFRFDPRDGNVLGLNNGYPSYNRNRDVIPPETMAVLNAIRCFGVFKCSDDKDNFGAVNPCFKAMKEQIVRCFSSQLGPSSLGISHYDGY